MTECEKEQNSAQLFLSMVNSWYLKFQGSDLPTPGGVNFSSDGVPHTGVVRRLAEFPSFWSFWMQLWTWRKSLSEL